MQEIDFDQFKIKNPNHRDTFQDLCYHLFCRKHKRNSGIFEYRNQVGIEVEPIKVGKNYVSFQAKFFDNGISYKDITDSIEKAKNKNCNLTKIVFYINLPLSESSKPKVKDSKDKIKVEQKAKNLGIKLDWVVPSNFKSLLNQKGNLDLAQFYFGTGDELGFIGSSCNPSMVTFLQSASHLKLPVKKLPAKKKIEDCILSNATKIFLILGHPGAGKTILIHKLFFDFSGIGKNRFQEMIKVLKKNKALPLLINLKDCVYKNIDNIIKERKDGYNISKDFPGFIYLFDGLDELSTERADRVLAYAASLAKEKQTKKIIISCRSGNQNRYLFGTYFSEFNEFEIDSLKIKFIEKYFSAKKNQAKIKKLNLLKRKNPNILKEIKDVFLTSLLWEVIDRLTFESSIIDLFEYKIKYLLADPRFKKNIEQLNLLDPKKRIISEINQEISFEFQKHFQYRFKRNEIQRTILNKLPRLSYRDVNGIFDYICSLFFMPGKPDPDSGESFIYQHRRYQEFFLVQKLKSEYEKNRKIVR
ncbi:MAG: hypothetical protein KAQ63_02065, partial [Candidatus Moranbacteria bacterium]|nr:hypothetical protein [Candidatus Moranbacteria bacterium]